MTKKTRCNGQWTEARFTSFIMSALRQASGRWAPKQEALKRARVERGKYKCAGCGEVGPATLPPPEGKTRRIKNACVDHIEPVVRLDEKAVDWGDRIARMFCEVDGLQVLCHNCHKSKTDEENKARREFKKTTKETK